MYGYVHSCVCVCKRSLKRHRDSETNRLTKEDKLSRTNREKDRQIALNVNFKKLKL